MDLKNKTAFVTGAAQGIGEAVALVLASYGADIIAADINLEGAQQTAKNIGKMGRKGLAVQLNVSKSESVNQAVEQAIQTFGTIDIHVNAAGIAVASKLTDVSEELWDRIMDVNAKGVFLCCKAVAKYMIKNKKGKIINVSSQTGKIGEEANGVYSCSKAAVNIFTQVFALEMAPYGINVNAVCPGPVDTEMMEKAFVNFGRIKGIEPEELKRNWIDSIPLKRMARPEEIGEIVAFLSSDKSDYITGVSYTIAGGSTLI